MTRDDDAPHERSLVIDYPLEAPPATVWRALTDPALLARWIVPEHGGESIRYERLSIEPRHRVSYRWREAAPDRRGAPLDSVVTFELTPTATGSHLRVVHEGFPAQQAAPVTARVVPLPRRRPVTGRGGGPLRMAA